ncbi:MAG: YicC family protein [Chlorobi bacterium]|nr:YicC family protein [Chlorobiota bacterium]
MIKSMTGFGKGIAKEGVVIVEAEIKTYNNRFQDIFIKLPRSVSDKEFEIRDRIRKSVKRGKISLTVYLKREDSDNKPVFIDKSGLETVKNILDEIKKASGIDDEISIENYLEFQNLILTDSAFDKEKEFELVSKAIDEAIADLIAMREQEGAELKKDMIARINNIAETINEIKSAERKTVEVYFQKLKERAQQLFEDLNENPDRLNMELSLIAERYDITEECVRMNSHIKLFHDALEKEEEAGRRLNFILQEMNREANTINSKTISSEIAHKGIFIKEELEKIREQIQNIE